MFSGAGAYLPALVFSQVTIMPTFSIDGCDLVYETHGEGELLVLLPGFASGAWSWKHQLPAFAERFRVITFDPRGVSRSINNGPSGTIGQIATDVAALLDHVGEAPANVLGISFGGFVAQEFALQFPDKVERLVLACTSFGGAGHVAPAPEVLMAFASVQGLNSADRIRQYLSMAFTKEFSDSSPEIVDEFCELREANVVPEDVYMTQLTSAMSFDTTNKVGSIVIPTLVLTGDADTVVPTQNSENLAAAIPSSTLQVIAGGSHMFFVERAREFNAAVVEFLTK
ncbi:MAG: alpha/beta hydrolase [Acidobacteria bacterium]|nr:alpha/beta hydrolase [Acidobacteriota bacterium]